MIQFVLNAFYIIANIPINPSGRQAGQANLVYRDYTLFFVSFAGKFTPS